MNHFNYTNPNLNWMLHIYSGCMCGILCMITAKNIGSNINIRTARCAIPAGLIILLCRTCRRRTEWSWRGWGGQMGTSIVKTVSCSGMSEVTRVSVTHRRMSFQYSGWILDIRYLYGSKLGTALRCLWPVESPVRGKQTRTTFNTYACVLMCFVTQFIKIFSLCAPHFRYARVSLQLLKTISASIS